MDIHIPKSCRFVYEALKSYGWLSNADLHRLTGKSSSDRMVRRLRTACPGLVMEREVKGKTGTIYKEFSIETEPQGRLF